MMNVITDPNAPAPVGPYSPALAFGPFIQISGQIPLRKDGSLETGSIEDQTHQVMKNISALVEAAGCSMSQIVKCHCFLNDMADFPAFNTVYAEYLSEPYPCRATVQAGLPKGAAVEVDALIWRGKDACEDD